MKQTNIPTNNRPDFTILFCALALLVVLILASCAPYRSSYTGCPITHGSEFRPSYRR